MRASACSLRVFSRSSLLCASPKQSTYTTPITRTFATSPKLQTQNRIYVPVSTPPTFHDYLRVSSTTNTLLLVLFTTSSCASCRYITPLLTQIVQSHTPNTAVDKFSSIAFTEAELDSADRSNSNMMDLGIEYGITSMPTLVGFGGRRSERVTERVSDTSMLGDRGRMVAWVDEVMRKGPPDGGTGGSGGGLLGLLGW